MISFLQIRHSSPKLTTALLNRGFHRSSTGKMLSREECNKVHQIKQLTLDETSKLDKILELVKRGSNRHEQDAALEALIFFSKKCHFNLCSIVESRNKKGRKFFKS